jgi:1-acyl-sn-glycerol-3-phosphate acyltransferase
MPAPLRIVEDVVEQRLESATTVHGPNKTLMQVIGPFWAAASDYYFRTEIEGWRRLPESPCLLVSIHAGAALTIDAWVFVYEWYRRFGDERVLHGTAHDVLMTAPLLGDYFKASGVIPASRKGVSQALECGHDVIVWPGGEEDSMRNWLRRDEVVLAGRRGFVKQAMKSGVPIVPVATAGGADSAFVLSEGRWLASALNKFGGIAKKLRASTLPILAAPPFGITLETLPTHLPLPTKLRYEILDPVEVDTDPERLEDDAYVDAKYDEVRRALQGGVNRLASRRRLPVLT